MEGNSYSFVVYHVGYTLYRKTLQIKVLDRGPNRRVNFISCKIF
jgi:hypothetical protein